MRVISLCNSQWPLYIHKQNFLHNLKSLIDFIKPYTYIHNYMTSTYCKKTIGLGSYPIRVISLCDS